MSVVPTANLIGPRRIDLRAEHARRKRQLRERALDTRAVKVAQAPVARAVRTQRILYLSAIKAAFTITYRNIRSRLSRELLRFHGLSLASIGILAGVIAVLIIFSWSAWLSGHRQVTSKVQAPGVAAQVPKPTQTSVAAAVTAPVKPTDRLVIPSINVNASVTELGLLKDNSLDAPKTMWQVGHYNKSAKPGENGTAVIDGHSGAPSQYGVLENLSRLKLGAIISYKYIDGRTVNFRVTSSAAYGENQAGANKLFAQTSGPSLNIVSCYGTWNPKTKDYSQRWIITSELVQ